MELVKVSHMKWDRPAGWQVDKDRWYHRRERAGDADRIQAMSDADPDGMIPAFTEHGRTYAGNADLCRAIDAKEGTR